MRADGEFVDGHLVGDLHVLAQHAVVDVRVAADGAVPADDAAADVGGGPYVDPLQQTAALHPRTLGDHHPLTYDDVRPNDCPFAYLRCGVHQHIAQQALPSTQRLCVELGGVGQVQHLTTEEVLRLT